MAWSQRAGSAIVDLASPLQAVSTHVEGDPVGSYSIMEADNLERLQDLLDGHPHTESGGTNRDSRVPPDGRRRGRWLRLVSPCPTRSTAPGSSPRS